MTERPSLAVGLMSGTSMDGMDAAVVRLSGPTHAELLGFVTRPYHESERAVIATALTGGTAREFAALHARLGEWAAEAVDQALAAAQVRASELAFIAFPGHTIWHEPPTVTWQLGEAALLAERFGVRVVSNFRARDVAAGGQGAPLVPVADVLLFGAADAPRVLLNIGGMANFTYVRCRGDDAGALALDTGPGMAVIDAVARMVEPGASFDRNGAISQRGRVREDVLAQLLSDPFFAAPPPRSTGREHFGDGYARRLHQQVPGPDGVATAVELTARAVARALRDWVQGEPEVVVSGGGAHHPGLMRSLAAALGPGGGNRLRRFDDLFFPGDAKEAVAFALLGYLTIHGQPGNLVAATGAAGPRVLGAVTPA
jgi:anhydro-N-acetylmuramic acid kinase